MRATELLESGNSFSVRQKDTWTDPGDRDEYMPDIVNWEYDVMLNGKVVGSIQLEHCPLTVYKNQFDIAHPPI